MSVISTIIKIQDGFTAPLRSMIQSLSNAGNALEILNNTVSQNPDLTGFREAQNAVSALQEAIGVATAACSDLQDQTITAPTVQQAAPVVSNPVVGLTEYQRQIAAVRQATTDLAARQANINAAAQKLTMFPQNEINRLNDLHSRLEAVSASVQRLSDSPVRGLGLDAANQKAAALQRNIQRTGKLQEQLNAAVSRMDVRAANAAYQQLNGLVGTIEREIQENTSRQREFNREVQNGSGAFRNLTGNIKSAVAAYLSFNALQGVATLSDTLSQTKARLDLINDGLQTNRELQEMTFTASQRSRGSYLDMAAAVSKMGILAKDAFSSSQEIIAFTEQLNKQFIIGGSSIEEQSAAMYQLTQAMASGRLQGDEFRSILENAPMLAQAIAREMGMTVGEMREASSQGEITAQIIKNALFSAADETNARFEAMPKTLSQIWNEIKGQAIMAFDPILSRINEIANDPQFQIFMNGIINGLYMVASAATQVFDILVTVGSAVYENWAWIGPLVLGIAAAFGVYKLSVLAAATAHAIHNGALMLAVPAYSLLTGATMADTAAQWGLNAALYACPIVWIIILIVALIAVIFAVIGAIIHFSDTSVSATGVVCGAFATAGAVIGNIFIALWNLVGDAVVLIWNLVADLANFLCNVFIDPIGAVCRLFFGLADTVLGILQGLASVLDTIFNFNLSGAVQGWRDSLGGWVDSTFGTGVEVVPKMDNGDWKKERLNYHDAYEAGYGFGDSSMLMQDPMADISGNVYDIAGNTEMMADGLEFAEEDLKYMRDLAEQEAINRFTTAEIKVDMGGVSNYVSGDTDLDGVVDYLTSGVYEAMEIAAEGI